MGEIQPDPYDVPGFDRATGVDDPTPRHEYHDEPPHHPPAYTECVTDCLKCGDDAPAGEELCGECATEEHQEWAADRRMERGL